MELKYYPDRVLKRRSRPLENVTDEVVERAHQMISFMYEADGVGLAAPQVGWSRRVITLDAGKDEPEGHAFVNPLITRREGLIEHEEGCLSLPGIKLKVPRAERITVVAFSLEGQRVEMEAEGLASCVWQHELDHLNGLLIIDRVPPTTLITVRDLLKKLEQQGPPAEQKKP